MIKFFIKIGVLFLILLIIFSGLNFVYKDYNFYESTIEEYNLEKQNIDVAIFGSSHAYHSYDVRLIEAELNLNSFNFGGVAQRLETTAVVIDKVLKENTPKLIIIDVFSMSIDGLKGESPKQLQLKTLDYLPLSLTKISLSKDIFDNDYVPYSLSPFLRNHYDWKKVNTLSLTRDYKMNNGIVFYKGFYSSDNTFNNNTWKKFLKKYDTKKIENKKLLVLSKDQKNKIDKIVNLVQKNNIPLIFVNSPSYVGEFSTKYKNLGIAIKNHIKNKKIRFCDFDSMRINKKIKKTDFTDPNHINTAGAYKITDSLVTFITENFTFEKTAKTKIFKKNKFYQIKSNFVNALVFDEVKGNEYSTKKVAIIKSSENRLELILESNFDKPLPITIEIELTDKQKNKVDLKDRMFVKDGNYYKWSKLTPINFFNYKEKNYKSFQFYYPFDSIKRIQIMLGEKNKFKILDKTALQLN